jgi:hypothetical protein
MTQSSGQDAGGVLGTTAPSAPGRLGTPLDAAEALEYLDELGRWRDDRRRELDQLDQAAIQAPDSAKLTGDIVLSMALWKSVSDRYDLLVATWDSGRVQTAELERMSALVWGRLDATLDPALLAQAPSTDMSALAVSLPEACRLSDALAGQLRVRLSLDPSGLEVAERVRQLRVQLERIRDQVELESDPGSRATAAAQQQEFVTRLDLIKEKSGRGGDVGGLLGPLELEATRFERDLIVNAATRRQAEAQVDKARVLRADLLVRAGALKQLVAQCVAAVDSSPRYAVPDVSALGATPTDPVAVTEFLRRLDQVSRAMTLAQDAYAAALRDHEELVSRLDAYRAKAGSVGVEDKADAERIFEMAAAELARRPTRMKIAGRLVELYQSYLADADQKGAP